jgi:hypothetical protein
MDSARLNGTNECQPIKQRQDLSILKLQGYVNETGDDEWLTTAADEIVFGSEQSVQGAKGEI